MLSSQFNWNSIRRISTSHDSPQELQMYSVRTRAEIRLSTKSAKKIFHSDR